MSHNVQGLIVRKGALAGRPDYAARAAALEQGFALLLLSDEPDYAPDNDPAWIPPALVSSAEQLSRSAPVGFVETAYFGGEGGQRAALWRDGRRETDVLSSGTGLEPEQRAINRVLTTLGVEVGDYFDAYSAVGLSAHRRNTEWLGAAHRVNVD
jgi:hypothetical protein